MLPRRNTLFYGDNLPILRQHIPDESVDLIYLDPPFNSNRNYNVLFKDESGRAADAQIQAFADTWHWGPSAEACFHEITTRSTPAVSSLIAAFRQFLGASQMMAYVTMMTARLAELYRVLKPTGSLYLHCDPTASHYLKLVLDAIFGLATFRSEIVWKRSSAHSDAKQGRRIHGHIHDTILFYTKGREWVWNPVYTEYDPVYIAENYRHIEQGTGRKFRVGDLTAAKGGGDTSFEWRVKRSISKADTWEADLTEEYRSPRDGWEYKGVLPYKGRYWAYSKSNMGNFARKDRLYYASSGMPNYKRYLDEMAGVPLQDVWDDIPPALGNQALGYPTQKPSALLERIVLCSSNENDIILDPFCGCGTTIAAAQKLNRRWIGIDVTHLSIALQKYRLRDTYSIYARKDYDVIGEPVDLADAHQLAQDDRYQFQWWAASLIEARPMGGEPGKKTGKKGADHGIDGIINFFDDASMRVKRVIVQVKSGKVKVGDIRDLRGVLDREQAPIGIFITLEPPSAPMIAEAASAGFYMSPGWKRPFARIQIMTVADLLDGAQPDLPNNATFTQAPKEQRSAEQYQKNLFDATAE